MKAESEVIGGNQIIRDVVTVAGILLILAAPVPHGRNDQRVTPLAKESAELQALADGGAPVEDLRTRALNAILLAENAIAAQMREVLPASELPHMTRARAARFRIWPGSRNTSSPTIAPTLPEDEILLVRKSGERLLATLGELRQRIADGATQHAVTAVPVARGASRRRSHVAAAH